MLIWLDRLPWIWLLLLAAWMALAPITPEPHLVEKLRLLAQGALVRPLDIFDLPVIGPILWARSAAPVVAMNRQLPASN